MSKKSYSKSVDRLNYSAVFTLFASVGLLISDRFADGTFSIVLLVLGFVGLIAFVYMVFKSGKMMDKEDKARAAEMEAQLHAPRQSWHGNSTRDLLNRSSLEDETQYRM